MLGKRASLEESLECFDRALTLCREHGDSSDDFEFLTATVHANRGAALGDMDRYAEAIESYDAAIRIYERLMETNKLPFAVRDWSVAVMNKGWALLNTGREAEGLECHELALGVLRKWNDENGWLDPEIARALYNVGEGYMRTKRMLQAMPQYEQQLEILRHLIARGRTEFEEDAAYAISSQADIMAQLGRNKDALRFCDEALAAFAQVARATENPKLAAAASTTAELRERVRRKLTG